MIEFDDEQSSNTCRIYEEIGRMLCNQAAEKTESLTLSIVELARLAEMSRTTVYKHAEVIALKNFLRSRELKLVELEKLRVREQQEHIAQLRAIASEKMLLLSRIAKLESRPVRIDRSAK